MTKRTRRRSSRSSSSSSASPPTRLSRRCRTVRAAETAVVAAAEAKSNVVAAGGSSSAAAAPTRHLLDLLRRSSWEKALCLCSTHPSDAAYRDQCVFEERYFAHDNREGYWKCEAGYTPLHMAMIKGAPPKVVRAIAASYPPAVVSTGKDDGRTPLHVLLSIAWLMEIHWPSESQVHDATIVRAFVKRHPPSAKLLCDTVAENLFLNLPEVVASRILEYVPHPALLQDGDGRTPLHVMCMRPRPDRNPVTKVLAKKCPRALNLRDKEGRTPLHHFLIRKIPNRSFGIFRELADLAGPEGLTVADCSENNALHFACGCPQPPKVIQFILRRAPELATMRNSGSDLVPLHLLIFETARKAGTFEVEDWGMFLAVATELAEADPASLSRTISLYCHDPPIPVSLLEFCRAMPPGDEGHDEGDEYQGPFYSGPMGQEIAQAFRQISAEYARDRGES